jgi:hypothetical protein
MYVQPLPVLCRFQASANCQPASYKPRQIILQNFKYNILALFFFFCGPQRAVSLPTALIHANVVRVQILMSCRFPGTKSASCK